MGKCISYAVKNVYVVNVEWKPVFIFIRKLTFNTTVL